MLAYSRTGNTERREREIVCSYYLIENVRVTILFRQHCRYLKIIIKVHRIIEIASETKCDKVRCANVDSKYELTVR